MSYKRQKGQKNLTKNLFKQYLIDHYNVDASGAYTKKTKNNGEGNNGYLGLGNLGLQNN